MFYKKKKKTTTSIFSPPGMTFAVWPECARLVSIYSKCPAYELTFTCNYPAASSFLVAQWITRMLIFFFRSTLSFFLLLLNNFSMIRKRNFQNVASCSLFFKGFLKEHKFRGFRRTMRARAHNAEKVSFYIFKKNLEYSLVDLDNFRQIKIPNIGQKKMM